MMERRSEESEEDFSAETSDIITTLVLREGDELPENCTSLVKLIVEFTTFNFPQEDKNGYCFPCLKILEFETRQPEHSQFFNRLVRSCPVLEDLKMYGHFERTDTEEFGQCFRISIPTLKKLNVELFLEELEYASEHRFIVKTPNLEYLTISDSSVASFVIDEIPSLLYASISIGIAKNFYKNQTCVFDEELEVRLKGIVNGITHAKSMYISSGTYAALSLVYEEVLLAIPFPSLLHLTLGIDHVNAWRLLPCFLRKSKTLEYLKLEREESELTFIEALAEGDIELDDYFGWEAPEFEPYISPKLKKIEMKNLWRYQDERDMANYLLTYANGLKMISVVFF